MRVEVLIADDVGRYVAGGDRGVVEAVAIRRPAVEFVDARRGERLVLAQARPVEAIRLPRVDDVRGAFAEDLALALAHDDVRRIAFGVHGDPVFAGLPHREGEVRRVDLEDLIGIEAAHAHVQRALRQLQLRDVVVEIEHGDARAGVEPEHGAADLELGARTGIHPETVADRQRPVDRRLHPVVFARRREAHRAGRVAEPDDAGRWIGAGKAAHGQHEQAKAKALKRSD